VVNMKTTRGGKKKIGCGNTRDPKTAKNHTVKRSQRVPRYVSACAQCKKTRSAEIAHFKMTVLGFYPKKHEVLNLPENVGISRLFPFVAERRGPPQARRRGSEREREKERERERERESQRAREKESERKRV